VTWIDPCPQCAFVASAARPEAAVRALYEHQLAAHGAPLPTARVIAPATTK
jgi:hypothetical protein